MFDRRFSNNPVGKSANRGAAAASFRRFRAQKEGTSFLRGVPSSVFRLPRRGAAFFDRLPCREVASFDRLPRGGPPLSK